MLGWVLALIGLSSYLTQDPCKFVVKSCWQVHTKTLAALRSERPPNLLLYLASTTTCCTVPITRSWNRVSNDGLAVTREKRNNLCCIPDFPCLTICVVGILPPTCFTHHPPAGLSIRKATYQSNPIKPDATSPGHRLRCTIMPCRIQRSCAHRRFDKAAHHTPPWKLRIARVADAVFFLLKRPSSSSSAAVAGTGCMPKNGAGVIWPFGSLSCPWRRRRW
ncbi:hypothetical protein IWX90DRAFT_104757 [Phyllosticta citrichinensis]|uniref:Secreted protein n=1 Tax=Phyllosticta citrichinensis TaxID=1130410 RepID=A0ABR1Y293_9PEZI